MFSAFNYSSKSQSPTRIKSRLKVKLTSDSDADTPDPSTQQKRHQGETICLPTAITSLIIFKFKLGSLTQQTEPAVNTEESVVTPRNIQSDLIFHSEDNEVQILFVEDGAGMNF